MPVGIFIRTDEYRKKMSLALTGITRSKETREKISLSISGEKHHHFGKHNLDSTKLKQSEALKGDKSYLWRGGIRYYSGYKAIYKPEHPYCRKAGYVLEHRLIMEQFLGRYLLPKEVVHHINGMITDNRIENLMLFKNNSEHRLYEYKIKKLAIA